MVNAYRDECEAVRSRIEALEQEIAAREARATPLFWQSLPGEMTHTLSATRPDALAPDAALPSLLSALDVRERHLVALDQALALLPAMEAAWQALPVDPPRLSAPSGINFSGLGFNLRENAQELKRSLEQLLPTFDAQARIWEEGAMHIRAELRVHDTPFALVASVNDKGMVLLLLGTSVCTASGSLRLDPEGIGDAVLKAVGLRREASVGDPEFDACFLIRSSTEVAHALLTEPVRAALLRMAREDVPRLEVGDGRAVLRWIYEPTASSLDAALRALALLRRAPPSLKLRG
jgi:hypothetical protein